MSRYKMTLEFDGTPFVGWQRQASGASVQGHLEEAILRYCGEAVTVHSAGRTDAGVHGLGMVAHADIARGDSAFRVREALNALLRPAPIAVLEVEEVAEPFHARFSCLERSYVYRILTRRAPAALEAGRVWWLPRSLDAQRMDEAAQVLIGNHDFTSFRASECQAQSPIKTLDELRVCRVGDCVEIHARARSFLHHQVRNMVGTLVRVGEGKRDRAWLEDVLRSCNRSRAGMTAPASGLYFKAARYPDSV